MSQEELNKELKEWQLCQLFKLEAEIAVFTKQVVPAWNSNLVKEEHSIIASTEGVSLPQKYADLWFESWKGSQDIVLNHAKDSQETMNWLLDKRMALRQNLCDYAKTELPAMRDAVGAPRENVGFDAVSEADKLWCESWQACMKLVSLG